MTDKELSSLLSGTLSILRESEERAERLEMAHRALLKSLQSALPNFDSSSIEKLMDSDDERTLSTHCQKRLALIDLRIEGLKGLQR
jgi:hypothetical protein